MSRELCAVDCTTSSVQVVVRRRSGLPAATAADLPTEAIDDGKVMQPVAVHLYVTRLLKSLGARTVDLRVTVPDSACVSRYLEYPKMPLGNLDRSLRLEAGRELPMSPRDAYLGWQVVEIRPDRMLVLLVGTWRDVLEGYLEALDEVGRVRIAEPRSMALARAVGSPDGVLLDWTGEDIQVVGVEGRRVTYTASTTLATGTEDSVNRLVHVIAALLPKAQGRTSAASRPLFLLGKLSERADVAQALVSAPAGKGFDIVPQWRPPEPYRSLANTCQVANIGLLMRN